MEAAIVKCPNCGQRNRVVTHSTSVAYLCGNKECRTDLSLELPPPFNRGVLHDYTIGLEGAVASHFGNSIPKFAVLIERAMKGNGVFSFWDFDEEYDFGYAVHTYLAFKSNVTTNPQFEQLNGQFHYAERVQTLAEPARRNSSDFGPQFLAIFRNGRLTTKSQITEIARVGAEQKGLKTSEGQDSACSAELNHRLRQLIYTWADESIIMRNNICEVFANAKPFMVRDDGTIFYC